MYGGCIYIDIINELKNFSINLLSYFYFKLQISYTMHMILNSFKKKKKKTTHVIHLYSLSYM